MSNELSLEKYFLLIRGQARLIATIFAAGIVLAALLTYQTPKMYTATSALNFDFNVVNPVDSTGRSLAEDTYLFTQIDIIKSQNVAQRVENSLTEYERERVIAALQAKNSVIDKVIGAISRAVSSLLGGNPQKGSAAPKAAAGSKGDEGAAAPVRKTLGVRSAYNWLARALVYDLTVEPRFNSRIVELSYSSTDRIVAALMTNKFAEAYIAANLEMMIDPARKTSAWFDEQLKSLRKKLEEAQSALTAYQQEQGIVSSDERLDTEISRLQQLSGQLVTAQQATRNAETAQQKLQSVLDSGASLMTFAPVANNSVIKSIKKEIRDFESEYVDLSSTLGENHPRRKRVYSELQAARERLQKEITSTTNGINNTAELAKTREHDLAAAMAAQKQLILNLKQERDKIAVLEREVESAQSAYNAALTQLNTTSMQSMLDQTNVSVVDPANVPVRPSSPKMVKNLILGGLAGLILGIGLVVFRELFNRRVYSADDITVELGIPLLGHLKKA